jgi:hypothetical protein
MRLASQGRTYSRGWCEGTDLSQTTIPKCFCNYSFGVRSCYNSRSCALTLFLAEKFGLVKDIITKLALELRYLTKDEWDTFEMPRLPIEAFLEDQDSTPTGVCAIFNRLPFH